MLLSPRNRAILVPSYLYLSPHVSKEKVGKEFTGNIVHIFKEKFKVEEKYMQKDVICHIIHQTSIGAIKK